MNGLRVGTRRVLITGGGTGIGRAVAEAILGRGGSVVVAGRRQGKLEEVVAQAPSGKAFALQCDLTREEERRDLVARAKALLGGFIDGVVHSAGEVVHQLPGAIDETSLRGQLELNLVAALRLGEQALRELDEGGGLVFVSSTLAHRPVPTSAVYSATKAGVLAMMKTFALQGAARGIRCNAVSPGVVDTALIRRARSDSDLLQLTALHPLGRLGRAEDVADAVLHLLGAPWTTGAELIVDGGLLLRE